MCGFLLLYLFHMKDSCVAKSYFVMLGAVDIADACLWVRAILPLFLIVLIVYFQITSNCFFC